jgi:hypothetical protein
MRRNAAFPVRCAVAFLATMALAACSDGPSVASGTDPVPAGSTLTSTPRPIPSGGSCGNLSPIHAGAHGLEAQGVMRDGGILYALFTDVDALTAGTPISAYWRLGGDRALRITMVGPDNRIVHATAVRPGVPTFPWGRPGEPWRSEVVFPQPGCWRVYVQRGVLDGEVWVRVT